MMMNLMHIGFVLLVSTDLIDGVFQRMTDYVFKIAYMCQSLSVVKFCDNNTIHDWQYTPMVPKCFMILLVTIDGQV